MLFKENEHELAINTFRLEIWEFLIHKNDENFLSNNSEVNNLLIVEAKLYFSDQIGYNSNNLFPGFGDPDDHSVFIFLKDDLSIMILHIFLQYSSKGRQLNPTLKYREKEINKRSF